MSETTIHIQFTNLYFVGVASCPGRPMIELSSRINAPEDSVTDEINLTWAVPDDDGGYPITGEDLVLKAKR